ncbi:quinone-dependent dihydroorotate dehydrogenase [Spongiibacter sp.]|uniref:quinone-dependent dihydroorotate dehydrogenase n=1 Tax=Spongiibacter sp. TaxID=2024860 RepID=UPI0035682196
MYSLIRPLLFRLSAETAHNVSLKALSAAHRLGLSGLLAARPEPCPVEVMGIRFPNPVGLAAGLDKDARHIDALAALGFGFIEVGTVTPRPQPGNPGPRLFRLPAAEAIINRMGFNNRGVDALVAAVTASHYDGVLGINIGKNKDTPAEQAVDDYLYCLRKVYPLASYVTVNLSSPNTPGLRDLQFGEPLRLLLQALKAAQLALAEEHGRYVPLAVKIAPDMVDEDVRDVARTFVETGIDAVIATNTTISREAVAGLLHAEEAGGLSGAPVREAATRVVRILADELAGRLPIIGVGGIASAEAAAEKVEAGAALLQVYTGFIYRGPALIRDAVRGASTVLRATRGG